MKLRSCCMLIATVCAQAACIPGGYPSPDSNCDSNKWMLQLHAVFMALGWGLCLPWGAGIAMYRRFIGQAGGGKIFKSHPSFYQSHRNLQVIGYTLTIAGFIVVYTALPKLWGPNAEHFHKSKTGQACKGLENEKGLYKPVFCTNDHTRLGLWIICLSSAQVLLGVAHHVLKKRFDTGSESAAGVPWIRPVIPSYIHVYLGWALVVMSLIQCALGCDLYANTYPYEGGENARIGTYLFLVLLAIVIIVNLFEQVKQWKLAGHCIPFKDGDKPFQFFPLSIMKSGTKNSVQMASIE